MILALNGCLTRIKKVADTNLQKVLGFLPDTFGIISLGSALLNFGLGYVFGKISAASPHRVRIARCYGGMPSVVYNQDVTYWAGPGYIAYCCCLVAAFIRCLMHYMTPVPKRDKAGGKIIGYGGDQCCCAYKCCKENCPSCQDCCIVDEDGLARQEERKEDQVL